MVSSFSHFIFGLAEIEGHLGHCYHSTYFDDAGLTIHHHIYNPTYL